MDVGQIIILIAYAVGFLIIFVYQKKKIGILITQIDKQKGILDRAESFMNIFNLYKVDKYVQMDAKRVQMESEAAMKKIKEQYESKAVISTKYLLNEISDLIGVLTELSFVFAYEPYFEKSINGIKNEFFRQLFLDGIKENRESLKSIGIEDDSMSGAIIRAVLSRMDLIEKK
jgi:hypothetical protein